MEEILTNLLKEVEQTPNMSVEDVLVKKTSEYGLSDEEKQILLDAFKFIDKITKEHQLLAEVRKEGGTRDSYISNSVTAIANGKSEEQFKEIVQAVNEVANTQVQNTKEGEE